MANPAIALLIGIILACATLRSTHAWTISEFGAVEGTNDRKTALLNAKAFEAALHAADWALRDQTVKIPKGKTYYMAQVKASGLNKVRIEVEGTLIFNDDVEIWGKDSEAQLYLKDVHHITICGGGTIDGQGLKWWRLAYVGIDHRPKMIRIEESTHIEMYNILLLNSPTFHVYFADCAHISVHDMEIFVEAHVHRHKPHLPHIIGKEGSTDPNIHIDNPINMKLDDKQHLRVPIPIIDSVQDTMEKYIEDAVGEVNSFVDSAFSWHRAALDDPRENAFMDEGDSGPADQVLEGLKDGLIYPLNTDGIDIKAFNVTIYNVNITNYDDAIVPKPCDSTGKYCTCAGNIHAYNNTINYSVGLSIGSVPPHDAVNCIRNVTFENTTMYRPFKALYIKSNPGKTGKGIIEDITYRNISIVEALWWTVWVGPQQQHQPREEGTGCNFLYPFIHTCPTNPLVTIQNISFENVRAEHTMPLFGAGVFLCDEKTPCTDMKFDGFVNTMFKGTVSEVVDVFTEAGLTSNPVVRVALGMYAKRIGESIVLPPVPVLDDALMRGIIDTQDAASSDSSSTTSSNFRVNSGLSDLQNGEAGANYDEGPYAGSYVGMNTFEAAKSDLEEVEWKPQGRLWFDYITENVYGNVHSTRPKPCVNDLSCWAE